MPVMTALTDDLAENGPSAVKTLSDAFSGLYQMVNAIRETFRKLFEWMQYGFNTGINALEFFYKAEVAVTTGHVDDLKASNGYRAKQQKKLGTTSAP